MYICVHIYILSFAFQMPLAYGCLNFSNTFQKWANIKNSSQLLPFFHKPSSLQVFPHLSKCRHHQLLCSSKLPRNYSEHFLFYQTAYLIHHRVLLSISYLYILFSSLTLQYAHVVQAIVCPLSLHTSFQHILQCHSLKSSSKTV